MRTRRRAVAAFALGLLFVSACGDDDDGGAPSAGDLDGRAFTASETEGFDLVDGSVVTITFAGDQISVATGCNTLTGGYSIDNGTLTTGALASTLKACEADLTEQETWVSGLVTSGPEVELDGDQLVLSSASGSITLAA